jgi:hypothetical protein
LVNREKTSRKRKVKVTAFREYSIKEVIVLRKLQRTIRVLLITPFLSFYSTQSIAKSAGRGELK